MERLTPIQRTIVAKDGAREATDFGDVKMPTAFTATSANTPADSTIPVEYIIGGGDRLDRLRAERDDLTTRIEMLEAEVAD